MTCCPFCQISSRKGIRAWVVHKDEETLAFFPEQPVHDGHILVIPRVHRAYVWELEETEAHSLLDTVLSVSRAVREALNPEGLNLIQSNGAAAGQTVEHLHFHVVPRWRGDAMGELWPASKFISEEQKAQTLGSIQTALGKTQAHGQ